MSPFQIWVRDDFCEGFREDSKVYLIESLLQQPRGRRGPLHHMRGRRRLRCRRRGGDRRLGDEGRGRGGGGGGGGGDPSRRAADAARPVLAPMAPAKSGE